MTKFMINHIIGKIDILNKIFKAHKLGIIIYKRSIRSKEINNKLRTIDIENIRSQNQIDHIKKECISISKFNRKRT